MKKISIAIVIPLLLVALIFGGGIGFIAGVASTHVGGEVIGSMFENEEKANTAAPREIDREHFFLKYPRNWNVDKNDDDYDPDHLFSINSPGNAFSMFILGEVKTDPENNVQEQIDSFHKVLTNSTTIRFSRFGKYLGKGAIMEGTLLGIKTTIRIFSTYEQEKTVIVISQFPNADKELVWSGLSQIEHSFELR